MGVRFEVTAVAVPGKGQAAAAWAAELAAYETENLGVPASWGVVVGGSWGKLCFFADYADMAEFEAEMQRSMLDEGYNELMSKGEVLFVPGSAEERLIWMP